MSEGHLWAQVTLLVLSGIALLGAANQHGKTKIGRHNFIQDLFFIALQLVLIAMAGGMSRIF